MSKTLLFEAHEVHAELIALRDSLINARKSTGRYEAFVLERTFRSSSRKPYYYVRKKGKTKRKYLGGDSSEEVNRIKEARYIKELLGIVEQDLRLLEEIESNYIIPDGITVNSRLPKTYRNSQLQASSQASDSAAARWKKMKEAEKAKYKPFKPERLIHPAIDGTMMRSKSEVMIANYLTAHGITFVYELPYWDGDKMALPDFTILSPVDHTTEIIIEHQGMLDLPEYQQKFIRSVRFYLHTDLIPNRDLFFTLDHEDGHIDLRQIDSILHTAFSYGAQSYLHVSA